MDTKSQRKSIHLDTKSVKPPPKSLLSTYRKTPINLPTFWEKFGKRLGMSVEVTEIIRDFTG